MRFMRPLALLPMAAALVLTACGDSEDSPPERGAVMYATLAGSATAAQIDAGTSASGLQSLSGTATCDVDIRFVKYMTRDPSGEAVTASEAVFVPSGDDASCTGTRPVLLYAHGTSTDKSFNMADITNNDEGSLAAAIFAAQGYIVVAPNYEGYYESSLTYHPFVNAEAQAVDMIDGLRAAKTHLAEASTVTPSSVLFVSGYSEGGHVAMATQKVMERDYASEFTITAAAPMSGPYNLSKFVTGIMSSPEYCTNLGSTDVNCAVAAGATLFAPLLLTSYQKSYGNLYDATSDVYTSAYADFIETLLPSSSTVAELIAAGKLPNDTTFRLLFGDDGMILESYRTAFLADTSNALLTDLTNNTLISWTPSAPMAMCYSAADPTVFAYNTTDAQTAFAANGVTVPALDLRGSTTTIASTLGTAAATLAGAFQASYPAASSAVGTSGTEEDHSNAAPFCMVFARAVFANYLSQ
jgi:poly(3-hydroxybutyrate) depolymerase